ncbi:HEAT repeat domain-containing protein [Roseomonas frigidaquae]|uniref:HEAT repeat domain-containing protein n=1 Tax=Falsiroseomonas frigidaquae TaxID=487318 RepID=A0ABX1F1T6_9PROT|nr:HEAT repeat domain-containing protein [Falsiroseomonas frigidaquae]NKE46299.1 HEAT repeat domain-containing protein [Falsiroseomonas frigidaquae]
MAFVRAAVPGLAPPPAATVEERVARLADADPTVRRLAARSLADAPVAAAALAARIEDEADLRVREALFGSLVSIGGTDVAALMAPFLRSQDAGLRNGALESLKQIGAESCRAAIDALVVDASPDVRLLAIEVTRAWPGPLAEPLLRQLIETDPHVNVCGAAVDVATELGSAALLAPLAALRARFVDEPFLAFAVDVARARIAGWQQPSGPKR